MRTRLFVTPPSKRNKTLAAPEVNFLKRNKFENF